MADAKAILELAGKGTRVISTRAKALLEVLAYMTEEETTQVFTEALTKQQQESLTKLLGDLLDEARNKRVLKTSPEMVHGFAISRPAIPMAVIFIGMLSYLSVPQLEKLANESLGLGKFAAVTYTLEKLAKLALKKKFVSATEVEILSSAESIKGH